MAGSPVRCYIDKFPIIDLSRFEWQISEGTTPYMTTFPMIKAKALELLAIQREKMVSNPKSPYLTLTMTDHLGTNLQFHNIYVLPADPYSDFRFLNITITDNRYFWNRINFNHAFNVKTKLGDRLILREAGSYGLKDIALPFETFEGFSYKTVSMYPPNLPQGTTGASDAESKPRPWTIPQIVNYIIEYYQDSPDQPSFSYGSDITELFKFETVVIEDLWIDTDIASALNQVLAYTRGLGLFVDNFGSPRFFNRTSGEDSLLSSMGVPHEPNEYYYYAKGDLASPKYIDVLFTKEIEVRFDFEETVPPSTEGVTTAEVDTINTEKRVLFNVMECPDAELLLPSGKIAVNGQYIRFQEAIPAFKTDSVSIAGGGDIGVSVTFEDIQRFWCINGWLAVLAGLNQVEPRVIWINRINAIKNHYRQTYQISKKWVDKMIGLSNHRVAIVDNATRTYAPSPIYQSYCVQHSERGIIAPEVMGTPETFKYMFNVEEFTGLIADSKQCETARLSLTDADDKGIIKVSFKEDPLGHYEKIYPSACINFPTSKMGDKSSSKFKDEPGTDGVFVSLAPTHRMATIMTATPSPNIKGDLYRVRVSIADAGKVIDGLAPKIFGSVAPPFEVRAPKQNITARFAWDDDYAEAIEANFGIGLADPTIDNLLLNKMQITTIAHRIAAEKWVHFQDRVKGGREGFLKLMYPRGTISRIIFRVESNAKSGTILKADADVTGPDFVNLLPASIRAFYFQQVDSKG